MCAGKDCDAIGLICGHMLTVRVVGFAFQLSERVRAETPSGLIAGICSLNGLGGLFSCMSGYGLKHPSGLVSGMCFLIDRLRPTLAAIKKGRTSLKGHCFSSRYLFSLHF